MTTPVNPYTSSNQVNVRSDATPQEMAAWLMWPGSGWDFAHDPAAVVGWATTSAASGSGPLNWLEVAKILVAAADNPNVTLGVLGQ